MANRMAASSFLNFVGDNQPGPSGQRASPPKPASAERQQSSGSNLSQFLAGGGGGGGGSATSQFVASSSGGGYAAQDTSEVQRRKLAKEAYARIRRYLEENDVIFNGAGEEGLARIEQSWSVYHSNPATRRANEDTLKGIAGILKEYPQLKAFVHGETGLAKSAPAKLASFLGMHPVNDVRACMAHLAENRANACLEELVRQGVPRSQLKVSFEPMGGGVKVDFIPMDYYATEPAPAPPSQTSYVCQRCPRLEGDIRALSNDLERLKHENERLRREGGKVTTVTDESERRRADALHAEVLRLREALANEERRVAERVRLEVERRVYEEREQDRRHIEALNEQLSRVRIEMERIVEENRRLKIELDDAFATTTTTSHQHVSYGGLELSEFFPVGIELGTLKRSEWRALFQQLVTELVRRRKSRVVEAPPLRRTQRTRYSDVDDVRTRVDRLWSSYRPSYTPPPQPVRRDADDFLRWGGGATSQRKDADDFLAWGGGAPPPRKDADAFLAFAGGGGGGTKTSTADDFLAFSSGGARPSSAEGLLSSLGGGGGGGTKALASDADAFLRFAN